MRDLIDRKSAIDALEEPPKVPDTWSDESAIGEREQWEKDVKALNSLPSAQPERCEDCGIFNKARLLIPQPERRKAKWIKMSDADGIYWACSECGEDLPRVSRYNPQFDLFPRLESIKKTKYCPNCGAEMIPDNAPLPDDDSIYG